MCTNCQEELLNEIVGMQHAAYEPCREWITNEHGAPQRCNVKSEFILWGKLFDGEALGPRCYHHASLHMNGHMDPHTISQYAIFDLRPFKPESPYAQA